MADGVPGALVGAEQVARETAPRRASNGVLYASYGDTHIEAKELERMVQAVPASIAAALRRTAYYFVPLAMGERRNDVAGHRGGKDATMVAPAFTTELADQAICHRNVPLGETDAVFISTRLLGDRFALSFEFFINVGHAFVDATGVPESFSELIWKQATADVRGETSQDAWENRNQALGSGKASGEERVDEKARSQFAEAAFSDAVAIYLLALSVDFDYSELREREYPLLAPRALAERLRLVASLFPPNSGYEFAIRYRRRA